MDLSEHKRNKTKQRHPWEIIRAKEIQRLIEKYSKNSKHILDFGSGDGYIINQLCLNKIGNFYTAIDSAYTEEILKDLKFDIKCNVRYLSSLPPLSTSKVDCVLLTDVLEHCENDDAVLSSITNKSFIKRNTIFIITVPAFNGLFSKHDEILNHFRRYNIKQLQTLCKNNGLEIIESGYFFFTPMVIRIIQLLLEKLKLRKPQKSIDNWNANNLFTKLVCSFLFLDLLITRFFLKIRIRLPGLSAYSICHSPNPSQ